MSAFYQSPSTNNANALLLFVWLFSKRSRIFDGLKMYIFCSNSKMVAKWLNSAPWRSNSVWFNRSSRNLVHTCIMLDEKKTHQFDKRNRKSFILMKYTQKSWLKITAPPGGNRQFLVFCTSYTLLYSSSSIDQNHVRLCQKGLKTLIMKSNQNCE